MGRVFVLLQVVMRRTQNLIVLSLFGLIDVDKRCRS